MTAGGTLLLGRGEVASLLDLGSAIEAVERAFRLHAEGRTLPPGVLAMPAPGGGFHVKAAGLRGSAPGAATDAGPVASPGGLRDGPPGAPSGGSPDAGGARTYAAVKVNANFPANPERHGRPAIQGLVLLADGETGEPLAVMDSIEITILRTGAATAVAARRLARPDSRVATICGCGNQGRVQLRALARVLPLERAWAWDAEPERARRFAAEMAAELAIAVLPAPDLAAAVAASDACVTATPSRRPFLAREWVAPGTFVAAVGADAPDKQELEPALLAGTTVVVDLLDQCAEIGELHHALEAGVLARGDVHAELAELVAGTKPGRRTREEIAVFDSTGTALQDAAAAAVVYERALEVGVGRRLDFAV